MATAATWCSSRRRSYKAILYTFGAGSYLPLRVAEAGLLGICALLFYALARSWAGPWACVAASVVLLFLGSSVEVVATPTGTVNLMPIAFGLAALICLQRFRSAADPITCLLLIASDRPVAAAMDWPSWPVPR